MKPILFNTEMVREILGGRKTMTRRVIKPQPIVDDAVGYVNGGWDAGKFRSLKTRRTWNPPCHVDDILYVRETWRVRDVFGDIARGDRTAEIEFKTGGDTICVPAFDYTPSYGAWKPSIHMPQEAARLFLRVMNVWVERLQDIDEEGAKAEGANFCNGKHVGVEEKMRRSAVERFAEIWSRTIKPADIDLYGWDANPWVWVIEFERCEKPVEVNCNG